MTAASRGHDGASGHDWQGRTDNRWVYLVVGIVLVALLVVGLLAYESEKESAAAREKAVQFVAALEEAGFDVRDHARAVEIAVALFGDDGGRLAEDPNDAFVRALLLNRLATSGGIATRPVILDRRMFVAEEIALSVYAPEKLEEFREFVEDLKTARTLRE